MASAEFSRQYSYRDGAEQFSVGQDMPGDTLSSERPLKSDLYIAAVRKIGADIITRAQAQERPLIVGVNGVDTSGKTEFAQTLADELADNDVPHAVLHVDDFMNPREVRHQSNDEIENYYDNMIDFPTIRSFLLSVHNGGVIDASFDHPHPADENLRLTHTYRIEGSPSVLIAEGVFLFRDGMRELFDRRIYLDLPFAHMLDRARARDYAWGGDAILEKYRTKYIPTQKHYIAEAQPAGNAHIVVATADVDAPDITKFD